MLIRPEVAAARSINRVIRTLDNTLEVSQPLKWLDRTEVNDADDDEITAKFSGSVYAADIVADDARAVTYNSGKLTMVSDNVPNLKFGIRLNQAEIKKYRRMGLALQGKDETGEYTDWKNRMAERLLQGIRIRREALIVAAKLDSIVYDRLGIKIVGSFGTPSDLKITTPMMWANTSALAVTDIEKNKAYAEDKYGRTYDRATMSTQEFINFCATTQFQNRAALQFKYTPAPGSISPYSDDAIQLFEAITGVKYDKYNTTLKTKQPDATEVTQRIQPLGKVILSNEADDNNESIFDLANGEITEALIAEMVNTTTIGLEGVQYGPATYLAPTSADLNPPGIANWGVARNFPRKHDETETMVLTVG
jgi:hypothetical protein